MFSRLYKNLVFLPMLLGVTSAHAQQMLVTQPTTTPPPIANNGSPNLSNIGTAPTTNATAFAIQAGVIGGVAQACGQDITVFIARVNEGIDRLSLSSSDKVIAIARLNKAVQDAQAQEITKQPFSCTQVMQDFNSLPIMRDDYRQTVLTQLSPTVGGNPAPQTAVPQGNPPGNTPTGPSPGALVGDLPPNINAISPGGTPPPNDFPDSATDQNAPNIIHQAPSVGPMVDTTRPAPNINNLAPDPYQDINPPANITNPYSAPFQTRQVPPPAPNP